MLIIVSSICEVLNDLVLQRTGNFLQLFDLLFPHFSIFHALDYVPDHSSNVIMHQFFRVQLISRFKSLKIFFMDFPIFYSVALKLIDDGREFCLNFLDFTPVDFLGLRLYDLDLLFLLT